MGNPYDATAGVHKVAHHVPVTRTFLAVASVDFAGEPLNSVAGEPTGNVSMQANPQEDPSMKKQKKQTPNSYDAVTELLDRLREKEQELDHARRMLHDDIAAFEARVDEHKANERARRESRGHRREFIDLAIGAGVTGVARIISAAVALEAFVEDGVKP